MDWEFKPAKVPSGISLRNFGIQLVSLVASSHYNLSIPKKPLYTSISDIVIYSPQGPTPTALRVAARFKKAVQKKRRERLERWVQAGFHHEEDGQGEQDPHSTLEGFLKYGVYVLDANAEQLERDLPWLVVRKDGECAGGCERTVPPRNEIVCCPLGSGVTHGLTEATDGRLVGELEIEARLAAEQKQTETRSASALPNADSTASLDQASGSPLSVNTRIHRCKRANTIDFAQREKDEMRDLTRASEILTVWGSDDRDVHVVCDLLLYSPLYSCVAL